MDPTKRRFWSLDEAESMYSDLESDYVAQRTTQREAAQRIMRVATTLNTAWSKRADTVATLVSIAHDLEQP
jgi:hypothetical protein